MAKIKKRTVFTDLWDLWIERTKTKKALRILVQQEWSVEFLTAMLYRAARLYQQPLEMTIESKNGTKLIVRTTDVNATPFKDDDIFNNLDDELKVQQFIDQVGKK